MGVVRAVEVHCYVLVDCLVWRVRNRGLLPVALASVGGVTARGRFSFPLEAGRTRLPRGAELCTWRFTAVLPEGRATEVFELGIFDVRGRLYPASPDDVARVNEVFNPPSRPAYGRPELVRD